MEAKSIQKYILTSPTKLREVVYMIRHMSPLEAIERLPFTHKKAADELQKVIQSAVANAKQKGIEEASLIFKAIEINEGPRLKRFRAGSRGRAKPYKKRMSHIRVVVETKPAPKPEKANHKKINGGTQIENKETKKGGTKKVVTKKGAAK